MATFVVMNEIQRNIWEIVKEKCSVMEIFDFLKEINPDFCYLKSSDIKIIDDYDRRLILLEIADKVNKKYAKIDSIKEMCVLFDQSYISNDPEKPFEYYEGMTIATERFAIFAKHIFEIYKKYLLDNNQIDKNDLIARLIKNVIQNKDIVKNKKNVSFHSSIIRDFPEFCAIF